MTLCGTDQASVASTESLLFFFSPHASVVTAKGRGI